MSEGRGKLSIRLLPGIFGKIRIEKVEGNL
jgi:hypothetical protein